MIMKKVIILLTAIICLCGCKTKEYFSVPEVRTDTVYINKMQRDSIWLHDSIYVTEKQKGDTIYVQLEKWHTKYVEKEMHDTTYIATHDTIPAPYPVPEYIEKQLSWWQKTKMGVGIIAMLAMLVWVVWNAAKIYMKRF